MRICAVIIDGRHSGVTLTISYKPVIRMAITKEDHISMGEEYDKSVRIGDYVEYHECYRSVDKEIVLYSTRGKATDLLNIIYRLKPTYPIPAPWK